MRLHSKIDDGNIISTAFLRPTKTGISYLHIQTTSAGADPFGIMLESLEMNLVRNHEWTRMDANDL